MKEKNLKKINSIKILSMMIGAILLCAFSSQTLIAAGMSSSDPLSADWSISGSLQDSVTQQDEGEPTQTPTPTATIEPTPTEISYLRPVIVIQKYSLQEGTITPGETVNLSVKFRNSGQATARNIVVVFETGNLVPLESGGLKSVTQLEPGDTVTILQPFTALNTLSGLESANLIIQVKYDDDKLTNYIESFSLNFSVEEQVYYFFPTPTPTENPEDKAYSQLLIQNYVLDKSPLEAGMVFNLEMDVTNMGLKAAKDVTLIIGGGFFDYPNTNGGSSGITASTADFSNFAPYNTSNLIYIGDIPPKNSLKIVCPMIVNTLTKPGVHTLPISFAYFDEDREKAFVDDQIITILVHRIPKVDVSFYRDPGALAVGQQSTLPIQLLNNDDETFLISSLEISSSQSTINPAFIQIGAIEAGGYFTQDFNITPEMKGSLEINIVLHYFDDFNQPQQIQKSLNLMVEEGTEVVVVENLVDDNPKDQSSEPTREAPNFLAVLWRIILGLLGLNSRI